MRYDEDVETKIKTTVDKLEEDENEDEEEYSSLEEYIFRQFIREVLSRYSHRHNKASTRRRSVIEKRG